MSSVVYITDIDSTGSKLFGGSTIFCHVEKIDYSGGNNIGDSPIIGTNTEIDADYDGIGQGALGSMFNRRTGYNSYAGFTNPAIKLTGNWTEETGSRFSAGSEILTPYKLWRIVHSDHQFRLTGGITQPNLANGEMGSLLYSSGIPVVFTQPWSISEDYRSGINKVNWNVTLRIDRLD